MKVVTQEAFPTFVGYKPLPDYRVALLSKRDVGTLTLAADLLEKLRETWGGDEGNDLDTDVALAMYLLRDLAALGQVEL